MAAVEDGKDTLIGLAEAFLGSKRLSIKRNKILSIKPNGDSRQSIEFVTQVPVENKTFYLSYGE